MRFVKKIIFYLFPMERVDAAWRGKKRLTDILEGLVAVYRGWMLNSEEYASLENAVAAASAKPFTSQTDYLAAQYLPNW